MEPNDDDDGDDDDDDDDDDDEGDENDDEDFDAFEAAVCVRRRGCRFVTCSACIRCGKKISHVSGRRKPDCSHCHAGMPWRRRRCGVRRLSEKDADDEDDDDEAEENDADEDEDA